MPPDFLIRLVRHIFNLPEVRLQLLIPPLVQVCPDLGPKALPSFLTRQSIRAREQLVQALMDYFRAGHHKTVSELLQARYAYIVDRHGINALADLARLELAGAFASIENTVPTIFWFLYRLLSEPAVLEDCRRELAPLVQNRNGASYVDIDSVKASCPILQSTLHETIRYHSVVISARMVTEDQVLDKYLLKKGSTLLISATIPHFDPKTWGPDVAQFKHTRFLQQGRVTTGKGTCQRMAFRGFRGGYHQCPGRHFSVREMLSLAAMVILHFDVTLVPGNAMFWPTTMYRPTGLRCRCPSMISPSSSSPEFTASGNSSFRGQESKWNC